MVKLKLLILRLSEKYLSNLGRISFTVWLCWLVQFTPLKKTEHIFLTLHDLSLLLPTTLSNLGEGGGGLSGPPLLTHEPFAVTTSNLVGC